MRTLKNDSRGTAIFLEREARGMDPMQAYREFVQNGIEASATSVTIDGWTDPQTGRTLIRITDNGCGLSHAQLVKRLSTLHGQFKADGNYGIGARIASLPFNRAGVTFASRTAAGEGMVRLVKRRGEYGIESWDVVDADGDPIKAEVVAPDERMLDRLGQTETGTAVILHGDGESDTWTNSTSYQVHHFLADRYYEFPDHVRVAVEDRSDSPKALRTVNPFGRELAKHAQCDGEVPFKNVAGLSGSMFWWVLPTTKERRKAQHKTYTRGGVGIAVDNELFNYSRTYASDFGLIYRTVQSQVAVLIWIERAEMDTARAGVVLPGKHRKTIPWKQLGAHFAEHMPPEISTLVATVSVPSIAFDAEMAKRLDEDWKKNLAPVKVPTPSKDGESTTGDELGESVPASAERQAPQSTGGSRGKTRSAAEATGGGESPAKIKAKTLPPAVRFVDAHEAVSEIGITWLPSDNTVQISKGFAPYIREVGRWAEKTHHSRQVIENAVQLAYATEYAATIVDANGQAKHGADATTVEELKSDTALYTKALGMQAITERIEDLLRTAVKV